MKKLISILMAVVMLLGVFGTIAAEEEGRGSCQPKFATFNSAVHVMLTGLLMN
jgi:hypothetical protein